MKTKEVNTVHLFAGCGGEATGAKLAVQKLGFKHHGIAINHWNVSVNTMRANHGDIDTFLMNVEDAVPGELVHGARVNLLWASPSCTHHSRAKGGKPLDNQMRAQPFSIATWLTGALVDHVVVENVPEIVGWCRLGANRKPLKSDIKLLDASVVGGIGQGRVMVGSYFRAWVDCIRACGYTVEWKILNCADYGDATSRRRFFLQAVRKGCGKIRWPEQTHARDPKSSLLTWNLERWRGAKEVIDFSDMGRSIFNRKSPLADNTLERVQVGLAKYDGIELDLVRLFKDGESPCRLTFGGDVGEPFVVRLNRHGTAESVGAPLSVVAAGGQHHMLCQPFIVRSNKGCFAESVEEPLSSQQASTVHHAIAQPIIVDHFRNGRAQDGSEPLGAQTTHDRFSVVQPFIVNNNTHNVPRKVDEPLFSLTTGNHAMLCTPLVLGQHGGAQARPVDEPCPTIATAGALRLVTTVVLDKGTGLPRLPDGRFLDIRMRMLKPSELAAAHSFPADYVLTGTRMEQVKQIGNSVPVRTAAAICEAALGVA